MFFLYVNVNKFVKIKRFKGFDFILDIELLLQGIMFISYIIIMCLSCFSTKNSQILCMVYVRFCFVQNFNLRNSIFKYDFITSKAHAWLHFKCYVCLRLAASTTMVRFI